jgi:hypothetical protein
MKNGTRPANDPSFDPVITFILRYLRPAMFVAVVFVLALTGWVFSL